MLPGSSPGHGQKCTAMAKVVNALVYLLYTLFDGYMNLFWVGARVTETADLQNLNYTSWV